MFITSINDVPVGTGVKEIVEQWDTVPAVRHELLGYLHPRGITPLTPEEVDAEFGECSLDDFRSPVWLRERVLGQLDFLVEALRWMEGGKKVIAPYEKRIHDFMAIARLVEWTTMPNVRQLTGKLRDSLQRAAFWFNIQMVASWLYGILPSHVEEMTVGRGLDYQREIAPQAGMVGGFAHIKGKEIYGHDVNRSRIALNEAVDGTTYLKTIFELSAEEIVRLGYARMGIETKPELVEPVQEFRRRSGIWVPDEL